MKVKITELEKMVRSALLKIYSEPDVDLITPVIMFGEISGKTSHGIVRLVGDKSSVLAMKPSGKTKIIRKSRFSSLIEGRGNPGMLVGPIAMNEVIKIGREYGFGIVGTRGSQSSTGCLSYYLEKIANCGLIGIIMAQSPISTAPYGGIEPLFGTNPISFAFPSKHRPLIFDMGTSAISYGAILQAKATGQLLPENVAVDKHGNSTRDASAAAEGATLTFDNSYKGSGLAMVVEILSGLWPGADFSGLNKNGGWGNLFIAIKPDIFTDLNKFKSNIKKFTDRVRNSRTKNGSKVRIPGEMTLDTRDSNLEKKYLMIPSELIDMVKNSRKL